MPESAPADAQLASWRDRIEAALDARLPSPQQAPQRLHAAMRHAVQGGGKRMRPLLVYACGTAFNADAAMLDAPAAAVELIHAYSLVHDDLPAMDDDALRRGQPTVHVAFDEATAILAGDALQSLAFESLVDAPLNADVRVAMLRELAIAAGAAGMCGGQALDIDATGKRGQSHFSGDANGLHEPVGQKNGSGPFSLEHLHALKTGALLRASVRLGAIAANADAAARARLDDFANALGLAFQIRDDLLDIEGDSATLGKTAGKDAAQDKATFPRLLGVQASRERLHALRTTMREALAQLGERARMLDLLAQHTIDRDR